MYIRIILMLCLGLLAGCISRFDAGTGSSFDTVDLSIGVLPVSGSLNPNQNLYPGLASAMNGHQLFRSIEPVASAPNKKFDLLLMAGPPGFSSDIKVVSGYSGQPLFESNITALYGLGGAKKAAYAIAKAFAVGTPAHQQIMAEREIFMKRTLVPPSSGSLPQATEAPPADVDLNIPEGEKAGRYDIAVIIGNRTYTQSGAPDVDFALRDARAVRDHVTRTMGFDPANVMYVENAPLARFQEIFGTREDHQGKLYKWVKPGESRVFVFYAGHGAPDIDTGEAYFVPVDASPQFLKVSGFRLQTFYDNLSKLPARKITVVLDACFSGNSAKGSLLTGTSALVRHEKQTRKPGSALVITSSAADQVSSWYAEKSHSLFTYYFLQGIRGQADLNNDGVITAGEMRHFLSEQVPYMARRLTGNEQTPETTGDAADVLAKLKR